MNKQQEFAQKLKALLVEYQASIGFDCSASSDLHGVYNPQIVATIDRKEVVLSYGYECYSNDIEVKIK